MIWRHFLTRYDVGTAVSFKGIAEGVENSNYLVDTTRGRFILTLYEKRVAAADLPYFLALIDASRRPRPARCRGRSSTATAARCRRFARPSGVPDRVPARRLGDRADARPMHSSGGAALGRLHAAAADFARQRANTLGLPDWHRLAAACRGQLGDRSTRRSTSWIASELAALDAGWPRDLATARRSMPTCFPTMCCCSTARVTGLIDFYFACTDIRAYDLAAMHMRVVLRARRPRLSMPNLGAALIAGYRSAHPLTSAETAALPHAVPGRSAALHADARVLMTG